MPGYTPPSARMRHIKQQEAVRREAEARIKEAEEPKVEVNVGAMKATVSAGPDGKLGTADDKVEIKPKAAAKKPSVKKAVPKPRPVPKFDKDMTKEQLLKVAKRMKAKGLTMRNTKADILKALKKATKSWK